MPNQIAGAAAGGTSEFFEKSQAILGLRSGTAQLGVKHLHAYG